MPDPSDLQPDFPVLSLRMLNCEANYQEASGILFGAPYDGTASFRPGSRFGPPAMRPGLDRTGKLQPLPGY